EAGIGELVGLGITVGALVGAAVGARVAAAVGAAVGTRVGTAVGAMVAGAASEEVIVGVGTGSTGAVVCRGEQAAPVAAHSSSRARRRLTSRSNRRRSCRGRTRTEPSGLARPSGTRTRHSGPRRHRAALAAGSSSAGQRRAH